MSKTTRDLHVQIPEALHRRLRIYTSITETTIRDTVEKALSMYLDQQLDSEKVQGYLNAVVRDDGQEEE